MSAPATSRFFEDLLREQQDLTAVERFSQLHDAMEPAEPAQAKHYRSLLPATPPSESQQYAFEVDLDACSGCKACVVACHTLNGLEEEESWRSVGTLVLDTADDARPAAAIQHVTTACHHCESPGCLEGCPVVAYTKDDATGIVRHWDDQCIGCKYCTMMCPYEVPRYSERLGIVRKCDMCHNRLAVNEAPACVQSCPNEAIRIRVVETQQQPGPPLAPGAPDSCITRPTTVFKSSRPNELALPQDAGVDEPAESHWPLVVMLTATQISVGILTVERLLSACLQLHSAVLSGALLLAALAACGVGMAFAPLHLGQPTRAWKVFLGLRTSWLSKEAVLLGGYAGALALATVVHWLGSGPFGSWLASGAWVLGAGGVASSAMVYIATRRELWSARRTFAGFGATTVLAGVACAMLVAVACHAELAGADVPLGLALIVASCLQAGIAIRQWRRELGPARPDDSRLLARRRRLIHEKLRSLGWLRVATSVGAALLLAVWGIAMTFGNHPTLLLALGAVGALSVVAAEGTERLLFFRAVVYDRMPGTLR